MAKKPKRFNNSYNYNYNRELPITYNKYSYWRTLYREAEFDRIEKTVKTGRIRPEKSKKRKLCLERYFGKINTTYTVIAYFHKKHIEVKTIWTKKGR